MSRNLDDFMSMPGAPNARPQRKQPSSSNQIAPSKPLALPISKAGSTPAPTSAQTHAPPKQQATAQNLSPVPAKPQSVPTVEDRKGIAAIFTRRPGKSALRRIVDSNAGVPSQSTPTSPLLLSPTGVATDLSHHRPTMDTGGAPAGSPSQGPTAPARQINSPIVGGGAEPGASSSVSASTTKAAASKRKRSSSEVEELTTKAADSKRKQSSSEVEDFAPMASHPEGLAFASRSPISQFQQDLALRRQKEQQMERQMEEISQQLSESRVKTEKMTAALSQWNREAEEMRFRLEMASDDE